LKEQTRKWSAIEIGFNLIVGLITSIFIFQPIIFAAYGISLGVTGNTVMAVWFTAISFVRGYFMRRLFIWLHRVMEDPKHSIGKLVIRYNKWKQRKK